MKNIIFSGKTKKGALYIIRSLDQGDAAPLLEYINALSAEQTFIKRQGEQNTFDEEKKFVEQEVKDINEKKAVHLVIESGGKIVGSCRVKLKEKISSHIGHLGISLAPGFRDQGIGKILFDLTLKESKNLIGIKIIDLTVFGINKKAIHLYESFGFKQFGWLPGGIKYKGEFVDEVNMYKVI